MYFITNCEEQRNAIREQINDLNSKHKEHTDYLKSIYIELVLKIGE